VATFNLKPVGCGYGLAEGPGSGRRLSFWVGQCWGPGRVGKRTGDDRPPAQRPWPAWVGPLTPLATRPGSTRRCRPIKRTGEGPPATDGFRARRADWTQLGEEPSLAVPVAFRLRDAPRSTRYGATRGGRAAQQTEAARRRLARQPTLAQSPSLRYPKMNAKLTSQTFGYAKLIGICSSLESHANESTANRTAAIRLKDSFDSTNSL
jgi:hypothetical protein